MSRNNGLNSTSPEGPLTQGNSVEKGLEKGILLYHLLLQEMCVIHISSFLSTPLQLVNTKGNKQTAFI